MWKTYNEMPYKVRMQLIWAKAMHHYANGSALRLVKPQ